METDYDHLVSRRAAFVQRQQRGKIVIRPEDRGMQNTRQGRLRYYLSDSHNDTCLPEWIVMLQEIPVRSGKHRHQGHVIIYVLHGTGHTVMDDVVRHWGPGDLVVLPVKPHGVVHQHFNDTPGEPAVWLALSNHTMYDLLGSVSEQLELAPASDS